MPTVKTYDRQVQGQPAPFVPSRAVIVPSRMGKVVHEAGRDAMALGSKFAQISLAANKEMQDRNDRAMAKDLYTAYGDEARDVRVDLRSRLLGNSKGTTAEAQKKLDEIAVRLSGDLENDTQRMYFDSFTASKRESFLDSHAVWEAAEMKKYNIMASEAMSREAIQYAMENHNNPEAIEGSKDDIKKAVSSAYEGAGDDVIQSAYEIKVTELHKGVVSAKAVNSAVEAKKYYDANEEEIDGDERPGLKTMLKTVGVVQRSMDKADEIMRTSDNYEDQLEMARGITDEEVRDATVKRIKIREGERRDIEAENKRVYADAKTDTILQHHKNGLSYESARDIALQAPKGVQMDLLSVVNRLYLKEEGVTNTDKMLEAYDMVDANKIKSRGQLVRDYMPHLSTVDFNQIEKYWQNGGTIGTLKHGRVLQIYKNLTMKDPAKRSSAADEYNAVWNVVVRSMVPGQEYTDDQLRKVVAAAVADGERSGGGLFYTDKNTSFANAQAEGHGNTWIPDVTSREIKEITKKLQAVGDPVSDFTIRYHKRVFILGLGTTDELNNKLNSEPRTYRIPKE